MKNLSRRISERMQQQPRSSRHSNRAVALALKQEVQQARSDGWSIRAIYRTLYEEGCVAFSYQAFRRYVNEFERHQKGGKKLPVKVVQKNPSSGVSGQSNGFKFNPTPSKEDLL